MEIHRWKVWGHPQADFSPRCGLSLIQCPWMSILLPEGRTEQEALLVSWDTQTILSRKAVTSPACIHVKTASHIERTSTRLWAFPGPVSHHRLPGTEEAFSKYLLSPVQQTMPWADAPVLQGPSEAPRGRPYLAPPQVRPGQQPALWHHP